MIQQVNAKKYLIISLIIGASKGTFKKTSNLVEDYIERCLKPYFLTNKLKKGLIILDQAKCHLTKEFQTALSDLNCEFLYIPPRLTGLFKFKNLSKTNSIFLNLGIMQPADVGWFKSLKSEYKKDWNTWFQSDEIKKVTRYGNICEPGYQNMISWIVKAWTNLQDVDKAKSFEYCGLTSSNQDKYH